MSWKRVHGHDALVLAFQRVIRRQRLAHAYLFTGPPGVGKKLFAVELAKTLLCEAPDSADVGWSSGKPVLPVVPLPAEVELPSTNRFTVLLASAVPEKLRFVVTLVISSDCELPLSLAEARLRAVGGAGAALSRVKVDVVVPFSVPAESTAWE